MNKKVRSTLVLLVFISMVGTCIAQPEMLPSPTLYPEQYSPYPGPYPGLYSEPYQSRPPGPYLEPYPGPSPGPYPEPYPSPIPGAITDSAPTATRPYVGAQPTSIPTVSVAEPISYLDQFQPLSTNEVYGLPGGSAISSYSYYSGIRQWIYYGGWWSYGPAALYYGQQTNTIIYNDQSQNIWSYERYPSGYDVWQYWGYWYPGYNHAWFGADAKGWHQIAIWGDRAGWSNAIWVYVW